MDLKTILRSKAKKKLPIAKSCDKIDKTYLINVTLHVAKDYTHKTMKLKLIANYLIGLFFNTEVKGKKIECTRTKLSKLLAVVQILYVKKHKSFAFNEEIFEDNCGLSIPALSAYGYPYNIMPPIKDCPDSICKEYYESNNRLNTTEIKKVDADISQMYVDAEVDDEIKEIIENVFLEFGAYSSIQLGKLLDQIKKYICEDKKVSLNKVEQFLTDEIEEESNSIRQFIQQF